MTNFYGSFEAMPPVIRSFAQAAGADLTRIKRRKTFGSGLILYTFCVRLNGELQEPSRWTCERMPNYSSLTPAGKCRPRAVAARIYWVDARLRIRENPFQS